MTEFKYEDFRGYEKKSYAKLEFLALEEEITPLVQKGLSAKAIFRFFTEKNRLTMCYQTFAYYMRKKYGSTRKPVFTNIISSTHKKEVTQNTTTNKYIDEQTILGISTKTIEHPAVNTDEDSEKLI